MPEIHYPSELPICQRREEILALLRAHQVLVIAGETGSGKTTQLPKMCLEAGLAEKGRIGCTQPRRVAAMSVSRRVAEELKVPWGREVGCKMRFNDDTSRETRVKFMTDGILLAEIQSDPLLRGYSALILDEAHERSLNIDFLLGYLQRLLPKRPDLKLIVTSATIDTEAFSKAFGGAPVLEVSGRLWPVEVRYHPIESFSADEDDIEINEVRAAVRAVEDALIESDFGDVLVFMPTEREIRETRELLEGSLGTGIEVLALYGRMPAAEQQRIFSASGRRRVIVATNIAETSITLPGIRYVVDTGLARLSRYNPRTRTKRLPVEAISQSSANQRAGRAGRVQDGICIRLYDEESYGKRPRFTQPEIQRANLAEVILRMKAFRLGEIESFPFIDPPPAAAIRAGYQLLVELGALSETHELTQIGRELARLPLDPTLGRMLLQARSEKALPEMLVIAAGLSVPDPRERPDEEKEAAAAAHRAFADVESDFIALLKIWQASPQAESRAGNNALRRFCKTNYLSFTRMRDWRDIHRQLCETLPPPRDGEPASRDAIHRSILAGLLGHISHREERNLYKASGNRQVTIFPGSGLYERREKSQKKEQKSKQPEWLVSGEIVQTSQLFARMNAKIEPPWVVELGAHLCQSRYLEPHWNPRAGRVLVWERVLIYGLEVIRRQIDYGKVNPAEATELFIRGALVADELRSPHRFLEENRKTREKIETALTRIRSNRVHDLEESLYQFYAARIENVSSAHDLNRLVRERIQKEPDFLCATEEDLAGESEFDRHLFPDQVSLENTALPVTYAYSPGEEKDGVTVRVPLPVAEQLSSAQLQWMVPGLREEQIDVLLRALPKSIRRILMPLPPKITEVAREFVPKRGEFLAELADFLSRKYQVQVRAQDWPPASLPPHLQPRVEVVDRGNATVAAGRNLAAVQAVLQKREERSDAWEICRRKWERGGLTRWSFDDLPEKVLVEEIGGAPVYGYPGLACSDGYAGVKLFRKREEAARSSAPAVRWLAEKELERDLSWVRKSLSELAKPASASRANFQDALQQLSARMQTPATAGDTSAMEHAAYEHVVRQALSLEPVFPLTEVRFGALLDSAKKALPLIARNAVEITRKILALRQALAGMTKRYPGMDRDVERLAAADFLAYTPPEWLSHLPRYLEAIRIRAERAALSPAKDLEKARQLEPFADWRQEVPEGNRETFRWMLEEFRVSLFAQELGTAHPVSVKRLEALLE